MRVLLALLVTVSLAGCGMVADSADTTEPQTQAQTAVPTTDHPSLAEVVDDLGDDDYRRVSSHDLRRCWANHLLVEENVSPRIVMALGGWSSYDAIEPYLAAPTESNIIETMQEVDL